MAIIYTYPSGSPTVDDLVLITDVDDGDRTKKATVGDVAPVREITAGIGISVNNPIGTVKVTNTGVLSIDSANAAILVNNTQASQTGVVRIKSITYGGGETIGHVPGGSSNDATLYLDGSGNWSTPPDTTYTAGDGLELTGTSFSTDLKAEGGLVIDSSELALDLAHQNIQGVLAPSNGGVGTGTQNAIAFWNSTSELGSSIITQKTQNKISIAAAANSTSATLEIPISTSTGPNASLGGISLNGGVQQASHANISPLATTGVIQFGSQSTGQIFDFRNNKISFDSDATNTFIKADTVDPENLEIHADRNIKLLADNYVIIQSPGIVPTSSSANGVQGSIKFDQDYLYICVGTNDWRRVELATF